MAKKAKATTGRSPVALAAHLRGGGGPMVDRRTKRLRTRGTVKQAALRDAA